MQLQTFGNDYGLQSTERLSVDENNADPNQRIPHQHKPASPVKMHSVDKQ